MTNRHPYQPGDIFYTSWGYDQTNVEFYEVVAVTPASVKVQQVASKLDESGRGVVPVPGEFYFGSRDVLRNPDTFQALCAFDGCPDAGNHEVGGWSIDGEPHLFEAQRDTSPILKRVGGGKTDNPNDRHYLKMSKWGRYAWPWDGTPKFDTLALGYAGH